MEHFCRQDIIYSSSYEGKKSAENRASTAHKLKWDSSILQKKNPTKIEANKRWNNFQVNTRLLESHTQEYVHEKGGLISQ